MESKNCTEKCNNWLENEKSMRRFLQCKYTKDITLTILVLIAVWVFRYFGFISNDVTGTLTGATIGYAMGGLRKLHE
jgi:predicted nucleic acid-binding Zn ribbon protein